MLALVGCAHRGPEVTQLPAGDDPGTVSTSGSPPTEVPPAPTVADTPSRAVAERSLVARFEGAGPTGTVGVREDGAGVRVDTDLSGLTSGTYRWTVHEGSDCSDLAHDSFGPEMGGGLGAPAPTGAGPGPVGLGSGGAPGATGTSPGETGSPGSAMGAPDFGRFDAVTGQGYRGSAGLPGGVSLSELQGRALVLRGPDGAAVSCGVFRDAGS